MRKEVLILAGDVGATHTRLAFFEGGIKKRGQKFLNASFSGPEAILQEFLRTETKMPIAACLGIAGPVSEGTCMATNLPWCIDAQNLSERFSISRVVLLNDLEASAYGLSMLRSEDFCLLQKGVPGQKKNQAVIIAGTGLGEAGLFWDGKRHRPFAGEGGHSDFSPQNDEEIDLLLYLRSRFGHVSWEKVASGSALFSLFRFLIDTGRYPLCPRLSDALQGGDPSRVISEQGLQGTDAACVKAVELFFSCFGAEAGNCALKFLSLGGIYIGGPLVRLGAHSSAIRFFLPAFLNKGRFHSLLKTIPVSIVMNDEAALWGAYRFILTSGRDSSHPFRA